MAFQGLLQFTETMTVPSWMWKIYSTGKNTEINLRYRYKWTEQLFLLLLWLLDIHVKFIVIMMENLQTFKPLFSLLENKFNLPKKSFAQEKLWNINRMTIQEEIES